MFYSKQVSKLFKIIIVVLSIGKNLLNTHLQCMHLFLNFLNELILICCFCHQTLKKLETLKECDKVKILSVLISS